MSDDLPSLIPEKSADQKAAADSSSKECGGELEEKITRSRIFINKVSRLTKFEWGGFFADLYVTLWVWSDLVSCRDTAKLVFLLATVFVAHGVLCYFLSKILVSWRWAIATWCVLSIFALVTALENSRHLPTNAAKSKPESSPPPDFSIAGTWFQNNGAAPKNEPYCWIVEAGNVTSLPSAVKVSFVNLMNVPTMIDSYVVEGQKTNGLWEVINYQTWGNPVKIFWGTDLKKVREFKYETFDSVIQKNNISPHETIQGWLFFTHKISDYQNLRFKFKDSTGISFQQPFIWPEKISMGGQPIMEEMTTNQEDISGLTRSY